MTLGRRGKTKKKQKQERKRKKKKKKPRTTKAWAVSPHWHPQEHQGLGCVTTLTTARTARLGLCHHIDDPKSTKAWAVSPH